MSDLLNESYCIIDSREKNKNRIEAVKSFFESNGGSTEIGCLSLTDYHIQGFFKEKEISLGIEAKSLNDFSGSYQDLPYKLARSFELYNDVGLFVEIPTFKVSSQDDFHATVVNPAVADGTANVLQYASMLNALASWQKEGVHVRQIGSEFLFGYAIGSVLINITKDTHRGLNISKTKDFKSLYLNCLAKLEGTGYITAQKIAKHFPNFHWLSSHCEEDLKDKLGKVTGSRLHTFLHCQDLETDEWRAGFREEKKAGEVVVQPSIPLPSPIPIDTLKQPVKSDEKKAKNKVVSMKKGQMDITSPPEDKTPHNSNLKGIDKKESLEFLDDNKPQFLDITEEAKKWYPAILAYIQSKPKGIEVNSIVNEIPACPEQVIFKLIKEFMDAGEAYEPKIGTILATTIKIPDEKVSEVFEVAPIVERDLQPSINDVVEYIRQKPRSMQEVSKEFGFSNDYCLKALYKLKEDNRIWFDKSRLVWDFGKDKNPMPVIATPEIDVGV